MYRVLKFCLILCTIIPLIEAVRLKIDGLINLGENWSYEYRVFRSGVDHSLQQNDSKAGRQTDEKKLRMLEDRMRKEAAEHRKEVQQKDVGKFDTHYKRRKDKSSENSVIHKTVHVGKRKIKASFSSESSSSESDFKKQKMATAMIYDDTTKKTKKIQRLISETRQTSETQESSESSATSRESAESSASWTNKTRHVARDDASSSSHDSIINIKNHVSPRAPRHSSKTLKSTLNETLEEGMESTLNKALENVESALNNILESTLNKSLGTNLNKTLESTLNKTLGSIESTLNKTLESTLNKTLESNLNKTTLESTLKNTLESFLNKSKENMSSIFNKTVPTLSTSTQVTTVRTDNIYTDPHNVKDDAKITEFTNHLYKQSLEVFETLKKRTSQEHLKVQIDRLARSYEDKFKEFLRDTGSQKIKTRLGTQKVILNTIDMSNRILRRLMNFMIINLDKKGILRHNSASANIFQKAIESQQKLQLVHACKKFGICRSGQGFSAFLTDMLTILMKCDDKKFKQSIDAFTEVVKNMNFHYVIQPHTEKKLKHIIEKIEVQDIDILRAIVLILKNTLSNKNKPMIVNNFSARQRIVNSTLALLEIIDLMDTKVPRNEKNVLEWADMKNSFEDFAAGKRYDILEIMTAVVKHVKANLKSLDGDSRRIVSKNLDMILH